MQKLTTEFVEAISVATDTTFWDTDLTGFGLRVLPTGIKTFVARAKVAGQLKKARIGSFPAISVAAGRRQAREALDAIKRGHDPAQDKIERRRTIESGAITIAALADRWMTEVVRPKRKARTVADYEKHFAKHINPALRTVPVKVLTWEDVNAFHASMSKTPRTANYVVSTLRALCNFAEKVRIRPPHSNPCKGVEFFRERQRERFLT